MILGDYLLIAMMAISAQAYFDLMAKGATFKEITLDALRRTPVVLPPLEDQMQIVTELNTILATLKALEAEASKTQNLLRERRSALISAAVTGKIDVRDWQPPTSTSTPTPAEVTHG